MEENKHTFHQNTGNTPQNSPQKPKRASRDISPSSTKKTSSSSEDKLGKDFYLPNIERKNPPASHEATIHTKKQSVSLPHRQPLRTAPISQKPTPKPMVSTPTPSAVPSHPISQSTPASNSIKAIPGTIIPQNTSVSSSSVQSDKKDAQNMKKTKTETKKKKNKKKSESGNTLLSVVKAVGYIMMILTVSICASYFIVKVGNDVFAFVKDGKEAEIVVTENMTIDEMAALLHENDIIEYPKIFKLYAALIEDDCEFVAGTYTIKNTLNYSELLSEFKEKYDMTQISVTIPEGYTVDQMIDLFVNTHKIGTREGFIDIIQNYDFKNYWFIDELTDLSPDRKYRLEGYLYPDTYYFYQSSSELDVITKLLNNFNVKFAEEYRSKAAELQMTVDEIVILASMIQKEALYVTDYATVSSVFHNRLNNPSVYPTLDSDATVQYALTERKVDLTQEDLDIDSPYNTYKAKGLPPGAICNPDLEAMKYALYPAESNYYFFVTQANGYALFAKNHDEHLINVEIIRAERNNSSDS